MNGRYPYFFLRAKKGGAPAPKGSTTKKGGTGSGLRALSWLALLILIGSSVWYGWPSFSGKHFLSNHQRKLDELKRKFPDAEVFEMGNEKKTEP